MILRTKNGRDFNTDKIWAIEYGMNMQQANGNTHTYWFVWKKYTTQRRMLQALYMLRKTTKSIYRPIHYNYSDEMYNLCEKSSREYKLKQLLEKN